MESNSNDKKFKIQEIEESKLTVYKHQNLESLIKTNYLKGENLTDQLFPPSNSSLTGIKLNDKLGQEDIISYDLVKTWLRAVEINDLIISKNNFHSSDIIQGSLGDCYFLSALASMSKFPEIIQNLFLYVDLEGISNLSQKEIESKSIDFSKFSTNFKTNLANQQDKTYEDINLYYSINYFKTFLFFLKFRIHGEWKILIIDDLFPTYFGTNELIFAKSKSNDFWVPIIEKAWAKIHEGYYRTSLGSPSEAFYCMTSAPTYLITHKLFDKPLDVWNRIKTSRDWILNSIIHLKGKKKKDYKALGLVTNHCYSILKVIEVEYNKSNLRFLLIRNPYGHNNWCGNYSDSSKLWTTQLKQLVGFNNKDEGSFWIELTDYFNLFDQTFICKYEKDFIYRSYKVRKSEINHESSAFIAKIDGKNNQSEVYFTIHQKYRRIYGKDLKKNMAHLFVLKIVNENQVLLEKLLKDGFIDVDSINKLNLQICCCGNNDRSVNVDSVLENGYYLIFSQIYSLDSNKRYPGFVLSSYINKQTTIDLKRLIIDQEISKNILEKSLISIALTRSVKEKYQDSNSFKVISFNDNDSGYGLIYICNKSNEDSIKIQLMFKDFYNLKTMNFAIANNNFEFNAPPNSQNLFYFRKLKLECGFTFTCREKIMTSITSLKNKILEKGEKKELKLNNKNCKVYFYTLVHSLGYLLMIENKSTLIFTGKLKFGKLENLTCSLAKNLQIDLIIKPNQKNYIELDIIDQNKKIGMSHGLSFTLK